MPDQRLPVVLEILGELVDGDGGDMWEIEDSVLLLTPSQVAGPPDLPPGGDPSGGRSPTRPLLPNASGAIALPEPHDPS